MRGNKLPNVEGTHWEVSSINRYLGQSLKSRTFLKSRLCVVGSVIRHGGDYFEKV